MSYFSYTNTIANGISADGGNVQTNFNDVRAAIIDGTKDIYIAQAQVSGLTASRALTTNASKIITASTVTDTELGYLSGVTSAIQTQIAAKPVYTAWAAYTPTGSWSSNTTYTGMYRRVGDTVQIRVKIALSGAPTSASLTVNLPSSHTIDTTKLLSTDARLTMGQVIISDNSNGNYYEGHVGYSSTTAVGIFDTFLDTFSGTQYIRVGTVTQITPMTFATADFISIYFEAPIVEYA